MPAGYALPFYKYSDFKDVGYAYDWLRVPQGVYGLGFDNIEGISFYRTAQLGNLESSLQLVAGGYSETTSFSGSEVNANIDSIAGITWELSGQALSLRLAYLRGTASIDVSPIALAPGFTVGNLFTTLDSIGAGALRQDIDIVNENAEHSASLATDAGSAIASISEEIEQINQLNSQIASATGEQRLVADRIAAYTEKMALSFKHTKGVQESVHDIPDALRGLSVDLSKVSAKFKT